MSNLPPVLKLAAAASTTNATQTITAEVNVGRIDAENVTITALQIVQGDSEEERARKIATARGLLAKEIADNLRSLDSRIGLARAAVGPDEFGAQLRTGMRNVAPVVAEINANAYAQLLSQQAAASLRQAFASAPLRVDLTDFIRQIVTTASVSPDDVHAFYQELREAAYRSDVVLETFDVGARKPDGLAEQRLSLSVRGLTLQSRLAFLYALRVLDAIPEQEPALHTLRILQRPRSIDAGLVEITRGLAELLREKAAFDVRLAQARDTELARGLADLEAMLTIQPTDQRNEVVGKAISLRQLGRVQDAEQAFLKYGAMFGAKDPTARLYATVAQAFTRQAGELHVHGGVYLFEVNAGAAATAGLRRGDVITEYGLFPVTNPNDLTAAIAKHAGDPKVPLHVLRYREDTKRFDRLSMHVFTGKLDAGLASI
ncbi:MAG TPA: PDZ domain-containing protein [Thermoanaerobaculia bacterium]